MSRYYRALYSQQIGALLGGGSNKNLPGMRNLAMELRKLCCHPVRLHHHTTPHHTTPRSALTQAQALGDGALPHAPHTRLAA